MKIGVIGDDPAGPVLAKAWANAGHELVGVFVESPEAIERIEALLPDVPINNMAAVAEDADLLVLAIPSVTWKSLALDWRTWGYLALRKLSCTCRRFWATRFLPMPHGSGQSQLLCIR